jgi:hypothetical protein
VGHTGKEWLLRREGEWREGVGEGRERVKERKGEGMEGEWGGCTVQHVHPEGGGTSSN